MQISTGPIGSIDKNKPIHIFGAGISGLLLAYYLKKQSFDVTVFEKSSRAGGKIRTELTPKGPIELAANAIFANNDAKELFQELGIPYLNATEKLHRKIFRNKKVYLKPLLFSEIIKIFFNAFKRPPLITFDTTVYDFFEPLLGEEICKDVLDAGLAGIYASSSHELHFSSLFRLEGKFSNYISFFLAFKRNKKGQTKPHTVSFQNGMQEFIKALEENLKENIVYNSQQEISDMANNIICTEAFNASLLTEKSYPTLSCLLKNISYIPLQTTTFILDIKIEILDSSFGLVFSKKNHPFLKGILHNSEIFKTRVGHNSYSYTFITHPINDARSDIIKELKTLFDIDIQNNILEFRTKTWEQAIPRYNKERAQTILKLRSEIFSYPPGLVLFGNYIDGISIREMIGHAKAFAQKLS